MEQITEGVKLQVKVVPKARSNIIENWPPDENISNEFKFRPTAPPEKGQANKAVIDILSKQLKVSKSNVILLTGETSKNKTFLLKGVNLDNLTNKN